MALDAILSHKREEVARRKATTSFESVLARCAPSGRSLAAALRAGAPGFLLEIKCGSPSAGRIRSDSDLEPVLAAYSRHADAVSVLADERFFGGSLARLAEVRGRLPQPILCKDFILEPYQVAEARAHGADAILLILAAVDDDTWRSCEALASRLGMEVLTEVHDEAEAARAIALGATMIGINNRDLRTLQVDLGVTRRVAPRIPPDHLVVAESGFDSREEVARQRPYADAFLVGSALMRRPDIDRAVRELVYGRTKVCGLTRAEDVESAIAVGATYGGLVFADDSARKVTVELGREVRAAAPLDWVGVFADQPAQQIAAVAAELGLTAVQLHGDEGPEEVAQVRAAVPQHCEVWKAARVRTQIPLRKAWNADRLLLDGSTPGRLGGTGHSFDWSLFDSYPDRPDVILAGGLSPDNVSRAAALGTFALDVSSGVEATPGRKDPARLASFFAARRRLPGRGGDP